MSTLPSPAPEDPVPLVSSWLAEIVASGRLKNPNAMALATSDRAGAPSVRMVLLKEIAPAGYAVFFTNYQSRKGAELDENPRAAAVLYWEPLGRQVRVEGTVEKITDALSDAYFHARARGSQIAAWASRQSRAADAGEREDLDRRWAETEEHFEGREVKRPPHWGGYRIKPDAIEFWESRPNRLHDRVRFEATTDGEWRVTRLDP